MSWATVDIPVLTPCPRCRKQVLPQAVFCPRCGMRLRNQQSLVPPPPPVRPPTPPARYIPPAAKQKKPSVRSSKGSWAAGLIALIVVQLFIRNAHHSTPTYTPPVVTPKYTPPPPMTLPRVSPTWTYPP